MDATVSYLVDNWIVLLPEIVLSLFVLAVMAVDVVVKRSSVAALVALGGVAAAIASSVFTWLQTDAVYLDAAVSDGFALGLRLVVLVAAGFGVLLSTHYIDRISEHGGPYYEVLLLAAIGMMLMGSAVDLIVIFVALEIFSLALYILSSFHRENPRSTEAGMKYFLLGAFASSFFVYGMALIYGAGGTTHLRELGVALAAGPDANALLLPGMALLIVGFGFKVSLVPFHMWTPDVYQGAPTPVTAFMSVGTKAAAFAAFLRVLIEALSAQQESWGMMLALLAAVTMTMGNLAALRQPSIKRMLAYSSVAHAGYLLVALVPGTAAGSAAALFYLFAYAFMNIGAFGVVIALERAGEGDLAQESLAGIGDKWPLLALAMSIFMFSLAGIPPLSGFFGKLFVFKAAVEADWAWLAAVGVINSAISAYYYLRVVVAIYFGNAASGTATQRHHWLGLNASLMLAAVGTVAIGLYPSFWTGLLAGLGG